MLRIIGGGFVVKEDTPLGDEGLRVGKYGAADLIPMVGRHLRGLVVTMVRVVMVDVDGGELVNVN